MYRCVWYVWSACFLGFVIFNFICLTVLAVTQNSNLPLKTFNSSWQVRVLFSNARVKKRKGHSAPIVIGFPKKPIRWLHTLDASKKLLSECVWTSSSAMFFWGNKIPGFKSFLSDFEPRVMPGFFGWSLKKKRDVSVVASLFSGFFGDFMAKRVQPKATLPMSKAALYVRRITSIQIEIFHQPR